MAITAAPVLLYTPGADALRVTVLLAGGVEILLYEPRHETAG